MAALVVAFLRACAAPALQSWAVKEQVGVLFCAVCSVLFEYECVLTS